MSDIAQGNTFALGLSAEQQQHRRGFVGGSDAAEIMSGDWQRLWRIKTGREEEGDLYDRLSAEMDYFVLKHFTRERLDLTRLLGHATEDLNAFWYEKQTGRTVERRREWAQSKRYPWMGANLDGVSTTSRGQRCYWDAKWTGRADEAFVLRHTPQGVHNATILGFDWWGLSIFIGNGKWEWTEQEIDPLYQADLIAREREFWKFVTDDVEPPEAEAPVLAPKPQPKRRQIDVPLNPDDPAFRAMVQRDNWLTEMLEAMGAFASTDAAAKRNAVARREADRLMPDDVGLVKRGRINAKRDGRGFSMMLDKETADAGSQE